MRTSPRWLDAGLLALFAALGALACAGSRDGAAAESGHVGPSRQATEAGPRTAPTSPDTPPSLGEVEAQRAPLHDPSATADLDALLEPVLAKHGVPALAGAIVRGQELVALGAVGVRAAGSDARVTRDDLWHLGSCTKAITATLAARLVEQRKLSWSTTLADAFPDLRDAMHESWRAVPIEWLLQNRAGAPPDLTSYGGLSMRIFAQKGTASDARRDVVETVLAAEPKRAPGSAFEYSNVGFVLAGAMLERIAGAPWEELVEREVFAPLGITSGGFGPPGSSETVDQPRGHRGGAALAPGILADNPPAYGPAGRAHMTVSDWARFVAAHLTGENGGSELLDPESFVRLHASPEGQSYAMGWVREPRAWAGGDALWHNGSNTLWYCVAWIAPAKDRAFLALTNVGGDAGAKACDEAVVAMLRREGLLE